jgi:hypothetical protein
MVKNGRLFISIFVSRFDIDKLALDDDVSVIRCLGEKGRGETVLSYRLHLETASRSVGDT